VANATFADNPVIFKPTKPDPLVAPEADSDIVSMMQGVVERGTGIAVAAVGKPLAGKTGTTSDWFDAWFVGFSPDLVAGVYVGFDDPRTLGTGEVGGHVAAPIFRDFMAQALKDVPAKPFSTAPGAALVASASSRTSGGTSSWSSNEDAASVDGVPADPDDGTPVGYNGNSRQGHTARKTHGYATAAAVDGVPTNLTEYPPGYPPGYPGRRAPGYATSQEPDDPPTPWTQRNAAPVITGYRPPPPGYAPGYTAPPRYSVRGWARPSGGTGGLY
jgi:penicillin-binding protein 1A